jgi:Flp pilus assembly protein TadD
VGQIRRVRLLLDLGRPADALVETRRLLAENPNDPEALELEGLCHLRLGARPEALDALGRSIARGPERPHPHYLYGFTLRELDRAAEAEKPLREALRLDADEPVYLRALAELYADQGQHDKALALARKAAELGPDRAANHVTYGYVASAAGDKALARAEYKRAVELDPADAAAWNNLGCLDLGAGQPLHARAKFREALRLDPRGERARRNLGLVAREMPPVRGWADVTMRLMDELIRAKAPLVDTLALALEAPESAQVLVRGGARGAAIGGAAVAMALRMMGGAAMLPLGAGAAMLGAAWIGWRRVLPDRRRRVAAVLAGGRSDFEAVWKRWLGAVSSRAQRDRELALLVEKMALEVVDHE